MKKKKVLTAGKKLKGDQAARAGDRLQAQALYASVCKLDPTDTEAWVKLALIEKGLGNFQQAERCARRGLTLDPKLGYGHYVLGQALHSQMQRNGAIASYRRAIDLMPDFADAHYLLGLALHEAGAMSEACGSLGRALRLRPAYPEVLAELGAISIDLGQVDVGLDYLQRAAALRPLDAGILGNISHALRLQGNMDAALAIFRRALCEAPDNVDLIAGLAKLLEKSGKTEEAEGLLARSFLLEPDHVLTNLLAARLDRRRQRLQQAAERLQGMLVPALTDDLSADIELELGQIYDQMGDARRAYSMVTEGKRKKALVILGGDGDSAGNGAYLTKLARIRQMATPALATELRWQIKSNGVQHNDAAVPVFFIGFPRSGTTLMEQILDSHPGIQTMEERPTVSHMVNLALDMLDKQQCALTDLREEQLAELRKLYFAETDKHISLRPGNILVDKMPLNTVDVPVIVRVFPNARFILAIRHPCDVSLSCLMQNFATNAGMANFFMIEDVVHLYAQVMNAWLHYVDVLPLHYHQIRYEDLIEDMVAETRKLLDFLGLPWDDAVLEHTEHARQRGSINTPSYHQVVQPIYQHSKFRWRRYEEQLRDVLPVLQPFIERFGYA